MEVLHRRIRCKELFFDTFILQCPAGKDRGLRQELDAAKKKTPWRNGFAETANQIQGI